VRHVFEFTFYSMLALAVLTCAGSGAHAAPVQPDKVDRVWQQLLEMSSDGPANSIQRGAGSINLNGSTDTGISFPWDLLPAGTRLFTSAAREPLTVTHTGKQFHETRRHNQLRDSGWTVVCRGSAGCC